MTVRKFTMLKSLKETMELSQPSTWDIDRSSGGRSQHEYPISPKEPLASHKIKDKHGITFAAQDTLPKLPIPDLDGTCKKYLDALKPLQNKREQEDTAIAVKEFLKSDGPELQSRLKKYATGKTSYIEQFCTWPMRNFADTKPDNGIG